MKIVNVIWNRLRSETPELFKGIRNLSIALAIAAGATISLYGTFSREVKDIIPIEFVKTLGITALVSTFISQLPVKNTEDIEDNKKINNK